MTLVYHTSPLTFQKNLRYDLVIHFKKSCNDEAHGAQPKE